MKLEEFDYHLPQHLIAQYPVSKRDECKLLIYNKKTNKVIHSVFKNIIHYINKEDIIIFNDTKVFPARLYGSKETSAKIEFLLLKRINQFEWETLIKPSKRIKANSIVIINDRNGNRTDIKIYSFKRIKSNIFRVKFNKALEFKDFETIGHIPLPPYIKRKADVILDKKYYQTVYAKHYGAVAAPTAGFHFTEELIESIKKKNIKIAYITLHISWDTFAPIRVENIEKHEMHSEFVIIPDETAELLNNKNGKVIAVGTTVVRALESIASVKGKISSYKGYVNTFIYPGYKFKIVDSLITNFHLPRTSLLLLVSAFIGTEKLKELYNIAIQKKYRFYSYGDAMFII